MAALAGGVAESDRGESRVHVEVEEPLLSELDAVSGCMRSLTSRTALLKYEAADLDSLVSDSRTGSAGYNSFTIL